MFQLMFYGLFMIGALQVFTWLMPLMGIASASSSAKR